MERLLFLLVVCLTSCLSVVAVLAVESVALETAVAVVEEAVAYFKRQ